MAEFAIIEEGAVVNVTTLSDEVCNGGTFPGSEPAGVAFLATLGITAVQTSEDGSYRGKRAQAGDVYDPVLDQFAPPAE